jgi:hypothetical protein
LRRRLDLSDPTSAMAESPSQYGVTRTRFGAARRQTHRDAGRAADQIRACRQSQNCAGDRSRRSSWTSAARRQGDRISREPTLPRMSLCGTSQPWQLPRGTAGHGSKADAGAQPLAGCQSASSGSPNSNRRSSGYSAPRRPLSLPRVRHANADARHGSCWVISPGVEMVGVVPVRVLLCPSHTRASRVA